MNIGVVQFYEPKVRGRCSKWVNDPTNRILSRIRVYPEKYFFKVLKSALCNELTHR